MILISHRGNINGPNPERENKPAQIDMAIDRGYHVEVDVWLGKNSNGQVGLTLGHDGVDFQQQVGIEWFRFRAHKLFIHAKNYEALCYLLAHPTPAMHPAAKLKFFFHEKERYSLIVNTSLIWCYDLENVNNFSIVPLLSQQDISMWEDKPVFGICSDYVGELKKMKL